LFGALGPGDPGPRIKGGWGLGGGFVIFERGSPCINASPKTPPPASEAAAAAALSRSSPTRRGQDHLDGTFCCCWAAPSMRPGRVKGAGEARRAKSDWMKDRAGTRHLGHQRGHDLRIFRTRCSTCWTRRAMRISRKTLIRTLTAADSAVMVIDAAKGIETQTRKLFEVCPLRDIPIMTFVNQDGPPKPASFRAAGRIVRSAPRSKPRRWCGRRAWAEFQGVLDLKTDNSSPSMIAVPVTKRRPRSWDPELKPSWTKM